MMVFQASVTKVAKGQQNQLQVLETVVIEAFKTKYGAATISTMLVNNREGLKAAIKSEKVWHALRFPDLLSADEKKNFAENMETLGKTKFGDLVTEAYGDRDGRPLRLLFNDLYHSDVGKAAAEKLGSFFFGLHMLFGLEITYQSLKVSDAELRKDFPYSKYPEKMFAKKELTKEQQSAYTNMELYLKNGAEVCRDAFYSFAKKYPKAASDIIRTQDFRQLFDESLKNKEGVGRVKELFLSSECREMFSNALDTAEGINVVGFLWNTTAGRAFIAGMAVPVGRFIGSLVGISTSNPFKIPAIAKTMMMIMDKQGKFDEGFKQKRQEMYKKEYDEENAPKKAAGKDEKKVVRKLKEVPMLLHKEAYESIVDAKDMEYLKGRYNKNGRLTDAEFEKRVHDAFERFYYDATVGKGGTLGGKKVREVDPTPDAREVIRKEYLMLKTDDQKKDYVFEGMEMYLKDGAQKSRVRITDDGETGILQGILPPALG